MNKNFYEKILVAKVLSKLLGTEDNTVTLSESFKYLQETGDSELEGYMWLNICGDAINWEENLSWVCYTILDIPIKQPGACPFSVSEDTINDFPEYAEWYYKVWNPYISSLLEKYRNIWEPRLKAKIIRGTKDVIKEIDSKYLKQSKQF